MVKVLRVCDIEFVKDLHVVDIACAIEHSTLILRVWIKLSVAKQQSTLKTHLSEFSIN